MAAEVIANADPYESDSRLRRGSRGHLLLPGGVGRSTYYTGAPAPYAVRGEGWRVWDDAGRELIDANNNFTTLIHGNAHPRLVEAASKAMSDGACWGIPNFHEWDHAEVLLQRLPAFDQVRYANSGTEAVMTAVRLARAVTGRDGCIFTAGGYHGSSDVALVPGGSHYTRGVPQSVQRDVTTVAVNDIDGLRSAVEAAPDRYAAIILDLIPNRAGLIQILPEYVRAARALADKFGIVLIFDEVISLRLGEAGFSSTYGIVPDLMTAGKLIGGGFPAGALIGREDLMSEFDPRSSHALPHAGTFTGNPVTMAAGAEALRMLTAAEIERINSLGDRARTAIKERVESVGWTVRGWGSLLRPFPAKGTVIRASDEQALWWAAHERGVLLSPANLIALSTPMTEAVVDDLVDRMVDAIKTIASS